MIKEALKDVVEGKDLSYDTAKEVMNEIMSGEASQMLVAAYLTALRMKGETIDEITASAEGMRSHATPFPYEGDLLEIVGTGGDEAALFAGTLFRMYSMYCERKHWKLEVLNENETGLGGYKEISFMITGKGAYSRMKFESGTHRVQRVPDTESSGRIHTSAATVAVLPVVEDVEIDINPADIKMDVFRAYGAGGQHVNKTSSAVRLTHVPTGLVAECQTERSQVQNREYAMRLLKSRLYEIEKTKRDSELRDARKSQVGSGDRSEKIRTYNYPQGRITDHRIGMSIYQMEDFLNGNLDEMINNLIAADRAERLKNE